MDKKVLIRNLLASENIYNTQSVYSDFSGVETPDIYSKGKFFSKNEYKNCKPNKTLYIKVFSRA